MSTADILRNAHTTMRAILGNLEEVAKATCGNPLLRYSPSQAGALADIRALHAQLLDESAHTWAITFAKRQGVVCFGGEWGESMHMAVAKFAGRLVSEGADAGGLVQLLAAAEFRRAEAELNSEFYRSLQVKCARQGTEASEERTGRGRRPNRDRDYGYFKEFIEEFAPMYGENVARFAEHNSSMPRSTMAGILKRGRLEYERRKKAAE